MSGATTVLPGGRVETTSAPVAWGIFLVRGAAWVAVLVWFNLEFTASEAPLYARLALGVAAGWGVLSFIDWLIGRVFPESGDEDLVQRDARLECEAASRAVPSVDLRPTDPEAP